VFTPVRTEPLRLPSFPRKRESRAPVLVLLVNGLIDASVHQTYNMMRLYDVYEHPDRGHKAVKVGFSWPAFFFGALWAFTKRLWLHGAAYLLFLWLLELVVEIFFGPSDLWWSLTETAAVSLVGLCFGLFGNDWRCKWLVNSGYHHVSRIPAPTSRVAIDRVSNWEDGELPQVPRSKRAGAYVLACAYLSLILTARAVLVGYYIPSPGMLDTFQINDRVFANRFAYAFSKPELGDVVVFRVLETIPRYDPDKPIWIQRIVGVGGDRVDIKDDRLLVNGKPVDDPPFLGQNRYLSTRYGMRSFEETLVPPDHVMLFGDNSANSYDSRYWGTVPEDRITGKVFFRFWPPSRYGSVVGESIDPLERKTPFLK